MTPMRLGASIRIFLAIVVASAGIYFAEPFIDRPFKIFAIAHLAAGFVVGAITILIARPYHAASMLVIGLIWGFVIGLSDFLDGIWIICIAVGLRYAHHRSDWFAFRWQG